MPTEQEPFNPGELLDDGEGLFLEFGDEEGGDAVAGGSQGGEGGEGEAAGGNDAGGEGEGERPAQFVPLDQFNKVLTEVAELRGRLAAKDETRTEYERPPQVDPNAQNQQQQVEQLLKRRIKDISTKLYDPDTAESAVEELLNLNSQLAAVQANSIVAQRLGSTQMAATDLIVENFLARKEKKDELYDEIEPLFEKEIAKYDRSQLVGRSRAELTAALDYLYKGVRADVLDSKFKAAKEKALQRRAAAPKLGGGRGASDLSGGRIASKGKVTDRMREFVRGAGYDDAQIDEIIGSAFGNGDEE